MDPVPRKNLTGHNAAMKTEYRHELFRRLRELNPHPTTELAYTSPFELLVAVILSAQATDVGVNKATRKLYPVANTAAQVLALGEEAAGGNRGADVEAAGVEGSAPLCSTGKDANLIQACFVRSFHGGRGGAALIWR